ncbi:YidB family protein [Streptomyces sp. CJ_13]|uniref:YidB family protein n=1 Tax=Streptomyces sp. CJ_13 TaxID=2724943 RepID=UPI001BDBC5B2|nr:YidB family protein [Streptomyces sp. CJ_13]
MTDPLNDGPVAPTTVPISVKDLLDAGLEPQLRSWISSGPNEPVTAEQLTQAIGEDRLTQAAESLGREPGDLAADLAADLPGLIDTASPDGRIEVARTRDEALGIQARAAGSIHAYIEGGPASIYNGRDAIALTTTFNGVTLTGTPQEIVDDASSTPGTQADMVIVAARSLDTQNGLYTADMTVIFDAVPRP